MQRMTVVCRHLSSQIWGKLSSDSLRSKSCNLDRTTSLVRLKHADSITSENEGDTQITTQFSGYIPVEELEFSYSKSSGPGGQHVNKVNTKVEVRFHVSNATWLPENIKTKLTKMEQNRITKEGYLVVTSERTRKQLLNQADVMDKLRSMIFHAAYKPRGLTEEEIQLKEKRLAKSKVETLRTKRQHSLIKQSRGSPSLKSL